LRALKDPPTAVWGILACGTLRSYQNLLSFIALAADQDPGLLRVTEMTSSLGMIQFGGGWWGTQNSKLNTIQWKAGWY